MTRQANVWTGTALALLMTSAQLPAAPTALPSVPQKSSDPSLTFIQDQPSEEELLRQQKEQQEAPAEQQPAEQQPAAPESPPETSWRRHGRIRQSPLAQHGDTMLLDQHRRAARPYPDMKKPAGPRKPFHPVFRRRVCCGRVGGAIPRKRGRGA